MGWDRKERKGGEKDSRRWRRVGMERGKTERHKDEGEPTRRGGGDNKESGM